MFESLLLIGFLFFFRGFALRITYVTRPALTSIFSLLVYFLVSFMIYCLLSDTFQVVFFISNGTEVFTFVGVGEYFFFYV